MENSNLNFNEFKNVGKEDWNDVVTRQVKSGSPSDTLEWSSEFGIPLEVYYDASARKDLSYLTQFFSTVLPHNWKLLEHVEVIDEKVANDRALDSLNGGCDGVLFSLNASSNLEMITKDILFEHCEVSFIFQNKSKSDTEYFQEKHNIKGFSVDRDVGSHSDRFSQPSGLDNLTEMVVDFALHPQERPTIFLRISQDFFHELARVRAVRYLFWRVAEVVGAKIDPNDILIHCEPIGIEEQSTNLFVHSSAGLAAIIGGANAISFNPMNSNPRISRNVGNLIREESKIATFQNAGTGSFFIDTLTDQMIQHVWSKLQEELGS